MVNQKRTIRSLVLMALFIAMSVVGSFIKIPSPTGTVALDSLPAFAAALLLGGIPGAIVGLLGHLATAATTGFNMTLPIHLIVAFQMAVIMLIVGLLSRKVHFTVAVLVGIILNGIGAPAVFILFPNMGMPFFIAMVLPLTVGSAINGILAGLIYHPLRSIRIIKEMQEVRNGI